MHAVTRTMQEEFKRNHELLLLACAALLPAFGVMDWLVGREAFLLSFAVRAGFSLVALGAWFVLRGVEAGRHARLVWATLPAFSIASLAVTMVQRNFTYGAALGIIVLPLVSSFLSLRRREALALFGVAQLFLCILPCALLFSEFPEKPLGLASFITGLAAWILSALNSASLFDLKLSQLKAMQELDGSNAEVSALLEVDRARMQEVSRAIKEIAAALGMLNGSIQGLQAESAQLASSSDLMEHAIADTLALGATVAQSVGLIDAKVSASRSTVETFGNWEREQAGPGRQQLRTDARDMAASVRRMGRVCELVTSVAKQSRILALNAGIEAAKETSSTFRVLCDSMKGFAADVRQRALRIGELTHRLRSTSERMEAGVSRYVSGTDEASARLGLTLEGVRQIAEELGRIRGLVEVVTAASGEQRASVDALSNSARRIDLRVDLLNGVAQNLLRMSESLGAALEGREVKPSPAPELSSLTALVADAPDEGFARF